MTLSTTLYSDLEARGLVKQVTDPELAASLAKRPITLYIGFDPTSDSLHVGSLLGVLLLRRFQLAGHKPIAVVGGATGMIGDPSGKSAERQLLTPDILAHNLRGITAVLTRFLDLDPAKPNAAKVVDNGSWFEGVSYIDFLRDVGKHFTINHMMAKESVRARLEDRDHGISYTEFSYMLLQAYDYKVLHDREGCRLQAGGSDQWGNITAGIELIRRMRAEERDRMSAERADAGAAHREEVPVYGFTHPLVTKADGTKFGKSESGTIWLDPKKTSPYRFYQFFIQTADADVITYLKYFSFKSIGEIDRLDEATRTQPEKREAQIALAREITELVHGRAELERAEKASQALFGAGIRELDEETLLDVLSGAPATVKDKVRLTGAPPEGGGAATGGYALIDALVDTGLCASKGAARKDVAAGGIYVNNERVADAASVLADKDLIAGRHVVLRKGKKTYHLLSFT